VSNDKLDAATVDNLMSEDLSKETANFAFDITNDKEHDMAVTPYQRL
jgi:hypothetical protein